MNSVKPIFLYFLFFAFSPSAVGQNFLLNYSIGNFKSASAFSISLSGYIFITDDIDNTVIKLDTLGKVIKEIGGYGWEKSAFYTPSDVFATTLNVIVSDTRNHRIQLFNKDLNFISELHTRESKITEEKFGFPLSAALSSMGDLYVLDSENIRILKFDLFGNFIQNFGGFDAGAFTLKKPKKLSIAPNNSIFVIDDSSLVIFGQFGNGKGRLNLGNSFSNVEISSNLLLLNNDHEIYMSNLDQDYNTLTKVSLLGLEDEIKIVSCIFFNGKLYMLTPNEIMVFIPIK